MDPAPPTVLHEATSQDSRRNAVFIVSDERVLPAARFLWWKLKRMNPRTDTDIILVAPEGVTRVLDQIARPEESVRLADLALPDLYYHAPGYLTPAAYGRLAVPRMLQSRYRRLFYLDVDTVPLDTRLFGLLDAPLQTPLAAAYDIVPSINPTYWTEGRMRQRDFLFDRYFNSGVLLIHTDRYVDADIDRRTYAAINRYGRELMHADQTALNLAVPEAFTPLSPAFNFRAGYCGSFLERRFPPSILHFNGGLKPWHRPNTLASGHTRALRRFLWREGAFDLLWRSTHWRKFLNRRKWGGGRRRYYSYVSEKNPLVAAILSGPYLDEAVAGNPGGYSGSSS